jgi:hypothetical protein
MLQLVALVLFASPAQVQVPSEEADVAKDDREVVTLAYHRFGGPETKRAYYLARHYRGERGSFNQRFGNFVLRYQQFVDDIPEKDQAKPEHKELMDKWAVLTKISAHIKNDGRVPTPPVVAILDQTWGKDVVVTAHDPKAYLEDKDNYESQITAWLRDMIRIMTPTPPAYSRSGKYAILNYSFGDIRHTWTRTLLFERVHDVWKIVMDRDNGWGRGD